MKYKGFSIYLKTRLRAKGGEYLEYRVVPPKGVEWPTHIPKSGEGLRTEKLTLAHAQRIVDRVEERQYNLDVGRAVNTEQPIKSIFPGYISWGSTYGGKKGTGWSKKTIKQANVELERWTAALGLKAVTDIKLLPFENQVAAMLAAGSRPATVENKARFLTGFCKYAKSRKLMAEDPLAIWPGLDTTPKQIHGDLEPAEIRRLMDAVTPRRRIIYGLAYWCRIRRSAIRDLKVKSMDWVRGGILADYMEIKSRDPKKAFVPVPQPLLGWLWEDTFGRDPEEPLTSISRNNAIKFFRRDLKRARIPPEKDGLKRTFHGLGASTATHLERGGVSEFAIADLMGHSEVDTTRLYLRERIARIQSAQRPLVLGIYPEIEKTQEKPIMETWHPVGTGAQESSQVIDIQGEKLVGMAGFEPTTPTSRT
ncbi:MAG: recombinase XerC [Fibrobacteres bacterium]|nr:recombinase XerC [Fibrobacterota bacterium]